MHALILFDDICDIIKLYTIHYHRKEGKKLPAIVEINIHKFARNAFISLCPRWSCHMESSVISDHAENEQ